MGKRIFIAIELPSLVKDFLADISAELRKAGGDVKWVRPYAIHLTLKFLGDVRCDMVPLLQAALGSAFSIQDPFDLQVGELGVFPGFRRPRVIWAGVRDNGGMLPPLVERIENILEPHGFSREKRPFNPHLTLGRVRSGDRMTDLEKAIHKNETIMGPTFLADHATIFESRLRPEGAQYHSLFRFEFPGT